VDHFVITTSIKVEQKDAFLRIEAYDRSSYGTHYLLNLSVTVLQQKSRQFCDNPQDMIDILRPALKSEQGCKSSASISGRVLTLRISLAVLGRNIEFDLQLSQEEAPSLEDRVGRLELQRGGNNSGDVFSQSHANIDIFHQGLGIVKARGGAARDSATTGVKYSSGLHYLEFRLLKCAHNQCMIGVQPDITVLKEYPGHPTIPTGKAIYGHNGHCYKDSISADYTLGEFGPGEFVGVLLNATVDPHTVTFFVNGRSGAALPLAHKAHYFVVCVYSVGDAVHLQPEYCYHRNA